MTDRLVRPLRNCGVWFPSSLRSGAGDPELRGLQRGVFNVIDRPDGSRAAGGLPARAAHL